MKTKLIFGVLSGLLLLDVAFAIPAVKSHAEAPVCDDKSYLDTDGTCHVYDFKCVWNNSITAIDPNCNPPTLPKYSPEYYDQAYQEYLAEGGTPVVENPATTHYSTDAPAVTNECGGK